LKKAPLSAQGSGAFCVYTNRRASHCSVSKQRMEEMMIRQGMLSRDLGTILVGEQAVYEGIISSVGGIREAVQKLHELADGYRAGRMKKKNSNSDKKKIK